MNPHADTDDGNLCDVLITHDRFRAHILPHFTDELHGFVKVRFWHRKSEIREAILAGILNDHVHNDAGLEDRIKDSGCHPRLIRDFSDGDSGLVFIVSHTRYRDFFHVLCFSNHHGTPFLVKSGSYMNRHIEFFGEFHRTDFKDFRTHGCHLQHFIV